jgi:hypothetical protein
MEPVKLLERAASGAVHVVRHPIASTAYAAGMVRGLAGAAVHGALVRGHDDAGGQPPAGRRTSQPAPSDGPERVLAEPGGLAPDEGSYEPGRPVAPEESFTTEPKAVSRDSEHGAPAADAEIDEWTAEVDDVDVETPVGTTGADAGFNPDTAEADLQQPDTEPLVDPSTTKAVKSESDVLRKAADPDKG